MSGPPVLHLPRKSLVAVITTVVCILILIAWATAFFDAQGGHNDYVSYATSLFFLPLMTLLVAIIVREHKQFLRKLFAKSGLTARLLLTGAAVGLLARVLWWAQVTARVSFGWINDAQHLVPEALTWSYACPDWPLLLMASLVWWVLVPISEEFIHRGVVLSSLAGRGPMFAILVSAAIFAAMHSPATYAWAFLFGVIFGVQYWNGKTLWAPIVTHATYDGLQVFDWICLKIRWNPDVESIPLWSVGLVSATTTLACGFAIAYLVSERWIGSAEPTQPSDTSECVGNTLNDV